MKARTFSAPGRIEIGGNHTDHQHGLVLAAAIDLKVWCQAVANDDSKVNIKNAQQSSFSVNLRNLDVQESEAGTSAALVRGVAAWFREHRYNIGGFDANVSSNVPIGSGLSSSAAFEVLIGNIFKGLYGAKVTPMEIAQAGKYAENKYFGKPCGLMDQAASSYGGLNMIDFSNPDAPEVTPVDIMFPEHSICVVETGGSHANLTPKYAAIPNEMMVVAGHFGKDYLHDVDPDMFFDSVGKLRQAGLSDRAILRAIHFFEENERVQKQVAALQQGQMRTFLDLVNASGRSSLAYLQNVFSSTDSYRQGLTLALALSEKLLAGKGAWRVHGGGFAGTILSIVPKRLKSEYKKHMCEVFGDGSCHFLKICADGGREV